MTRRPAEQASSDTSGGPSGRLDSLITVATAIGGACVLTALQNPGPSTAAVSVASAVVIPVFAVRSVLRRQPPVITSADRVTLLRVALTGVLTAALVLAFTEAMPSRTWTVLILAGAAAVLDAVDGWVARRVGTGTSAGARFDSEADAAALLVLSALLAMTVGWWVLLIGLMRYLFVAASFLRPRWRRPRPYSGFRRAVAAAQATVVVVGLAPVVPVPLAAGLAGAALAALLISFGRDILLLERTSSSGGPGPRTGQQR